MKHRFQYNFFNWLKNRKSKFSNVANMVYGMMAVPGSSVAVERLFSQAGKVHSKQRLKLDDNTFRNLMMLKTNHKLLPFKNDISYLIDKTNADQDEKSKNKRKKIGSDASSSSVILIDSQ